MRAYMTLTAAPEPMPVQAGDELKSFRGEWWVFDRISRMPEPGRSGKVEVHDPEDPTRKMEFYDSVFPGLKLEAD